MIEFDRCQGEDWSEWVRDSADLLRKKAKEDRLAANPIREPLVDRDPGDESEAA